MRRSVLVFLMAAAAWAGAGPTSIRRIDFEPRREKQDVGLRPGSPINAAGAMELADTMRRRLAEAGYREASVRTELLPAGPHQADLKITVDRGPRYEVEEVRFTGELALPEPALKRAVRPIHLTYSDAAIHGYIARLESLYASRGYFDARVTLGEVRRDRARMTLFFAIRPGPKYDANGFSAPAMCACLREAWREAQRGGRLDFDTRLVLDGVADHPARVRLAARTDPGRPYTVGRIEFRGNHRYGDTTLRRVLLIEEGGVLDWERLRRSVARLNRLNLFEPLTDADVDVDPDREAGRAKVLIRVREKPRGRWFLSGPAAPVLLAGPLQASLISRLPGWGRGLVEGSTWYASASLLAFSKPLASLLPFVPKSSRFLPLFGIARPILPGQEWLSGFTYSPQLGWRAAAMSYALSQGNRGVRGLLNADSPAGQPLVVPLEWSNGEAANAGALICEGPHSKWGTLRAAGIMAADWLLGGVPALF